MKMPRERQTVNQLSAVSGVFFVLFLEGFHLSVYFCKIQLCIFLKSGSSVGSLCDGFFDLFDLVIRHKKLQNNLVGILGIQDWQASFSRDILDLTDPCIIRCHLKRNPVMFLNYSAGRKSGLDCP